ncbi:G-protein coupled receptor 26 isoform X3 [Rhinichthys klamathensis goyatoka]|uniref:G-protein coupled receptor 26 isoform X3 n=1 Tax=Rhinichthys klamathensis goyatoka TaxID=3034132 RepID=UPI0024B5151F|nr:G-protein coupled receptor 26 isoform X3 [Rhinichthys klamathensis goyatoka]
MDFAEILLALFIVVVAIVSLVSNLLVLLCFIHSSEIRRQVPGVFTMNLSFCNILISVLNMPSTLIGILKHQQPFGECLCGTLSFLETFLTANSMLSMAALSIDRWIAVVFPLSYSSKMRYQDALVMVLKVARFHCKRIDIITMQTLFLLVDIHPSVKQRCLSEQKRRKQRATKKISIFIGSFIICFAPYVITRLTELFPFVDVNRHWGIVSKCLTYSKAASDPFVYSLLRQQYKKVLITVANRLLKRDLNPSSGHSSSMDTENDYSLQRIS